LIERLNIRAAPGVVTTMDLSTDGGTLPRPFGREGARADDIEGLFRRRHRAFLRVAIAIAGSREAGEDALQEGLARALARRRTFRGDGALEAWLWRVIVNAARNTRRNAHRQQLEVETPVEPGGDDHDRVRAAVAALPDRQRLVLFLRYYADLDYATIARTLRIRRGTVSATLNQAHAALRRALDEEVEA
jgi:RNA polymerase sigma factor (sigma-70 family)